MLHITHAQVLTQGRISKACDVYSFGVILHELYCGQPAWRQRINKNQKPDQAPASTRSNGAALTPDQASSAKKQGLSDSPEAESGAQEGAGTGACTAQTPSSAPDSPLAASSAAQGGAGSQQHDPSALLDMSNPTVIRSGPDTSGPLAHSLSSSGQGTGLQPSAAALSAPPSQAAGCDGGVIDALMASTTSMTEVALPPAMPTPQETLKAMQRFLTIPEGTCPLVFPPSCPHW
jgi:serine/threonine protein kinase